MADAFGWPDASDLAARLELDAPLGAVTEEAVGKAVAATNRWISNRTCLGLDADPPIGDDVALAAEIYAALYYRSKDSPEGIIGSSEAGVIRVMGFDIRAERLLSFSLPAPHA